MKDEKKTSFIKKIFGQRSSCCSLELEEIDSNEDKILPPKTNPAANCCCCPPSEIDVKKDKDNKE
jgi:hypothetical protein